MYLDDQQETIVSTKSDKLKFHISYWDFLLKNPAEIKQAPQMFVYFFF